MKLETDSRHPFRWTWTLGAIAALAVGCPQSTPASDAATSDAGATYCYEGGLPSDASVENVSMRDAAACPADVESINPGGGFCEGQSRAQCQRWAAGNAGPEAGSAYATCFPNFESGPCLRVSFCDPSVDGGNCHCGREPACPAGFVCAADSPCGVPYCRCATP